MHIRRLRISNFRCLDQVEIEPSPGVNVIVGDNASGKTSVLEAIFFLGRGQSFRRSATRTAIRSGSAEFTINAEIDALGARGHRLAIHRNRTVIRYKRDNDRETSRLDLVNTLPLQVIDPNVHRLLEQGPRYRRHFLDWGVFHVEQLFFPAWRRYRRALRQRNRALKARWPKKDVISWDAELVRGAEIVDACRRSYVEQLHTHLPQRARRLLGSQPVIIEYEPGWRGNEGYGAALAGGLDQDLRAGYTQQGPHRADLRVSIASTAARDWVSRGQQKILTSAMLLVQAEQLYQQRGLRPVLLIDDLAAELGTLYRTALAEEIRQLCGQCFLTFLDASMVPEALGNAAMFHVEHGRIKPL